MAAVPQLSVPYFQQPSVQTLADTEAETAASSSSTHKSKFLRNSSSGPVASDSVSVPGGVGTAPVEVDLGVSGKKKGDDSVVTDSVPVPNSTVLAPLVSAVSEVSKISVADSSVPIDQCAHMDFTPVLSADLVADLPVSDPKTVAADIIKEAVIDCSTIIINSDVAAAFISELQQDSSSSQVNQSHQVAPSLPAQSNFISVLDLDLALQAENPAAITNTSSAQEVSFHDAYQTN
ncbi:hypothetical protein JRO89_XS12G0165100 [Xanthoceras sorbifolium]|uniref:Uncharacterized protein n=1 Tax=Xanthoceras sorbifolium TaxID=99658 RepID=A0ABQ8HCW1_9ROSI|nr:hypothetical protein JRO89_XS12G0165100 [Xanthoceras sorbifolium]